MTSGWRLKQGTPASGSSQCTSPKHPVSCIEPGLAIHIFESLKLEGSYIGDLL